MISIFVAVSENGVIGNKGALPWKLSSDLKRFSALTNGHPVIMGRKTWESLPSNFRPLPKRTNILVTRKDDYPAAGAKVAPSLEEAFKIAEKSPGNEEIFIIGGAEIYKQAFPFAQKIYLTKVKAEVNGDAYFPEIKKTEWKVTEEIHHQKDDKNEFDYTFLIYESR